MGHKRRLRHRKRLYRTLPPIGLRARILGSVEYLCPYCYRQTRSLCVMASKSRFVCRLCRKSVAFGVYGHLGGPFSAPEPFKALFCDQDSLYHLNRLTLLPTDVTIPAIGRITGKTEWVCPHCSYWALGTPTWKTGELNCPKCHQPFWVSLLIWSVTPGHKKYMPHDWIPPLSPQPLPAQAPEPEPRPDSDGAGAAGSLPLWS